MKLKKLFCIAFAIIFVVVASAIDINTAHVEDVLEQKGSCCDNYRGTSERYVPGTHDRSGEGCQSWLQKYCASCGTVFDTWYGTYNICPHE